MLAAGERGHSEAKVKADAIAAHEEKVCVRVCERE
jgi:hypothetical protein